MGCQQVKDIPSIEFASTEDSLAEQHIDVRRE
jgi:hypothetical protein